MNAFRQLLIGSTVSLFLSNLSFAEIPYPFFEVDSVEVSPREIRLGETVQVAVHIHRDRPLSERCEYHRCWGADSWPDGRAQGSLGSDGYMETGSCTIEKIDDLNYKITMTQEVASPRRQLGTYHFRSLSMKMRCSGDADFGGGGGGELLELVGD